MKSLFTIAILLVVLTFPGCLEETGLHGLPELTTNGLNTIGCVVNGKTIYNAYTSAAEAHWSTERQQLYMDIQFNDHSQLIVDLYAPDTKVVDFKIDSTDIPDSVYYNNDSHFSNVVYSAGDGCTYSAGFPSSTATFNSMNIHFVRFDTSGDSGVISATFDLTFKKDGCPDLEIVEGRFDIMIGDKPHIGPF